ncbi:lytic transglycosylase domain-containing protein [Nocardia noduli]|uniref:lytic transglycosylase domain-containing protein n=1 Tax=Nocardia noduli TaxID=2815722 RepID=UPI001C2181E8|nr:lytic murein transglycosylase [Nocardia noduli]
MGRHRKPSTGVKVGRTSVLALSGLLPAGVIAVAGASDLDPAMQADIQPSPEEDRDALGARLAAALDETADHAMAQQGFRAPPVVKTVALPDNRARAEMPAGPLGIPGIAVAAYQNAEQVLHTEDPECGMSWSMLAGIGRVESTHAFGGKADADGNPLAPVYGPVLDGSLYGNHVIHDSDDGALDGLSGYDRAIGPMQFLPDTWKRYAADGNNDGVADPQNLFDATLTAGKYLCSGGLDMRDMSQQTRAILRYNNSMAYVANVMAWANSYNNGVAPKPAELPRI